MIKDQELAIQILDMINTALEAVNQLYTFLEMDRKAEFEQLWQDLNRLFISVGNVSEKLQKEESGLNLCQAMPSVQQSLLRIVEYSKKDVKKALQKIEFELFPLLEDLRLNFYFWGMVYPDQNKMKKYYEEEIKDYSGNVYIEDAEKNGSYKYELSIVVRAYDKLDYTKKCIESLLKNLPSDISYELILVNHGSNDGTKEYFESLHPNKQLDIAVNGGGVSAFVRILEGKYMLHISNDVLVGANAIENLYACMESDPLIAWAVPATSNISNLQTIPLEYSSQEEFEKAAEENNKRDPFRWEQRVRLCNPIDIRRNYYFQEMGIYGQLYSKNQFAFPDDKSSLFCRRNGYKNVLVKDAYCHHFGSITIKEEWKKEEDDEVYLRGRKEFFNAYGVDPWGKGFCYDYDLFQALTLEKKDSVKILGVNCGLGSNPLKIKELLKELHYSKKMTLYNITNEKQFYEDIKGVSDYVYYNSDINRMIQFYKFEKFDYIIIQERLAGKYDKKHIEQLSDKLNLGGVLILEASKPEEIDWFCKRFSGVQQIQVMLGNSKWLYYKK